jgi:hypothetical protein
MYGLYYPAILGTGVVVALQHAAQSIHSPAMSVAVTAGAFFSLSFASAMGFEKEYGPVPFLLDVVEVIGMFACFVFLSLIDLPGVSPSVTLAYIVLIAVVAFQVAWRKAMSLQVDAYLDLKLTLALLLLIGAVLGDHHTRLHWAITGIFSITAWLYVRNHPYQTGVPVPRWFIVGK